MPETEESYCKHSASWEAKYFSICISRCERAWPGDVCEDVLKETACLRCLRRDRQQPREGQVWNAVTSNIITPFFVVAVSLVLKANHHGGLRKKMTPILFSSSLFEVKATCMAFKPFLSHPSTTCRGFFSLHRVKGVNGTSTVVCSLTTGSSQGPGVQSQCWAQTPGGLRGLLS